MMMEFKVRKHTRVRSGRLVFNLLPDSCDGKRNLFHFTRCHGRHSSVVYFSWVGLWFWCGWRTT